MAGSAKGNSFYLFIFYFLFSSLIIYVDSRGFLADLHRTVQSFTIPVESRLFALRGALLSPFSAIFSTDDKDRKIQELEEENTRLLAQVSQLKGVEEENTKARYLLGATLPPSWHFEPARVVSSFADRIYLTSDFEPKEGTPVIASQEKNGVLVGQVKEIVGKRAVVTLPTNERVKIGVRVRDRETGERHGSGIVAGRGGTLVLEQVLTSETIEEGDLVITAGNEKLPPELLVGYVTRVHDVKGAFREAEVKPAIDAMKLDFVFLITKW